MNPIKKDRTQEPSFRIQEAVYDRFLELFTEKVENLKVGDPMDPETSMGPMASASSINELAAQVRDAVAAGARLLAQYGTRLGEGFES